MKTMTTEQAKILLMKYAERLIEVGKTTLRNGQEVLPCCVIMDASGEMSLVGLVGGRDTKAAQMQAVRQDHRG